MVRLFIIEFSSVRLTNISHVDIAFVLNGQSEQSMEPVTLHLTITVSANRTSPSDPHKIPTEGDDSPPEEVPEHNIVPDSRGPDQSTAREPPLPSPDRLPAHSSTPMPQDQAETSLVEKARTDLDRADEVKLKKLIDRSDTWEGVVGKIKWVMDTLSPVAEVRVIFVLPILD